MPGFAGTAPKKHRFAYDASDRVHVIDTPDYTIQQLFFQNTEGFTLWTTIYTTLKEYSQSIWFSNDNYDMKYTIESGEAWFLIAGKGPKGEVVVAGKEICVPKNAKHMVLNNSKQPCVYKFECPGPMDLREYLGNPMK